MRFKSDCSRCFAGLSCRARVKIIDLLRNRKKLSVTEIGKHFKITQPTITHHLKYLKTVGILSSKKEGRSVYYYINPKCGWDNCEIFT